MRDYIGVYLTPIVYIVLSMHLCDTLYIDEYLVRGADLCEYLLIEIPLALGKLLILNIFQSIHAVADILLLDGFDDI